MVHINLDKNIAYAASGGVAENSFVMFIDDTHVKTITPEIGFQWWKNIFYYEGQSIAGNKQLPLNSLYSIYNNCIFANAPIKNPTVYLQGILSEEDGLFYFENFVNDSQIPTEEDSKVYILLGRANSASSLALFLNHPVMIFQNGFFQKMGMISHENEKIATMQDEINTIQKDITDMNKTIAQIQVRLTSYQTPSMYTVSDLPPSNQKVIWINSSNDDYVPYICVNGQWIGLGSIYK